MADTAAAIAPVAVAPVAAVGGATLGLSATHTASSSSLVQTQTRLSIGGKPYDIAVCPWLKFGPTGGQPIYPRNPAKAAGNYPRINKCLAEVMAAASVASSGDVAMVLQWGSALGAYMVGGAMRGDNDLDNHIFTTKSGAELEAWAKTHAPTCHPTNQGAVIRGCRNTLRMSVARWRRTVPEGHDSPDDELVRPEFMGAARGARGQRGVYPAQEAAATRAPSKSERPHANGDPKDGR